MPRATVECVVRLPVELPEHADVRKLIQFRAGTRERVCGAGRVSQAVSRRGEMDVGMRVPVGRFVAPASSTARSRCSIAAWRSAPLISTHPRARCGLAAAAVAAWPISSASARASRARSSARSASPVCELDQRRGTRSARMLVARRLAPGSVRASSSGARASSSRPARKRACPSGTRPAYRHSLRARLGLEHEPGRLLGVRDTTAEVRRADHRDHGADRRDSVGERAVVGTVLCDAEPSLDFVAPLAAQPCAECANGRELAVLQRLRPGEGVEPAVDRRHSTDGQQRDGRTQSRACSRA